LVSGDLQNAAAPIPVQDEKAASTLIETDIGSVDINLCSKGLSAFFNHMGTHLFDDSGCTLGDWCRVAFVQLNPG
jgi:hypothetical protein